MIAYSKEKKNLTSVCIWQEKRKQISKNESMDIIKDSLKHDIVRVYR